jgi:RsiW-degrading membrane proteinase PrsW (M82 family)
MIFLLVISLAVAPGLFWLWFFYQKDKLEPEPKKLIAITFFLGVLLAIPLVEVQLFFFIFTPLVLMPIIVAPITEELGKFLVVRLSVYDNPAFNEPIDGIIYAAAAALGFASIENVFYVWGAYQQAASTNDGVNGVVLVFILRSLLSVPGHALWSILWGYGLGLAKFSPRERRGRMLRNGLVLSMFFHGLFNALLVIFPLGALGVLILILFGWQMAFRLIAKALALSPFVKKDKY